MTKSTVGHCQMMYNLQVSVIGVSEMAKSTVGHCQMMYNLQISVFGGSEMAKSRPPLCLACDSHILYNAKCDL